MVRGLEHEADGGQDLGFGVFELGYDGVAVHELDDFGEDGEFVRGDLALCAGFGVGLAGVGHAGGEGGNFGVGGLLEVDAATATAVGACAGFDCFVHFAFEGAATAYISH